MLAVWLGNTQSNKRRDTTSSWISTWLKENLNISLFGPVYLLLAEKYIFATRNLKETFQEKAGDPEERACLLRGWCDIYHEEAQSQTTLHPL